MALASVAGSSTFRDCYIILIRTRSEYVLDKFLQKGTVVLVFMMWDSLKLFGTSSSLFIVTVLLCWAFQISEDPSAPIDREEFGEGVIAQPLPFKAIFEPRIHLLEQFLVSDT